MAPSRRRTGSSRRTVRRNSSAWSGSTSYSSVTSTGPSSPSSWEAVSGSDQQQRRAREERRGDVRVRRDHAPEEAAHRHAALEGQEAHGERPCPHPRGHGVLGGDAERGHGAHPRHAADEEPAARDERHARKRDDGGHGGEDGRAREDETVAGEALADAWQEGRAHDRARAEAPEEEPVARRRELESPAREERE